MGQLALDIPHALTQEEAARRLKKKIAAARAEHEGRVSDLREEWLEHKFSFAFKAMGMAVSGTVAVEPTLIRLAATLPMAAMFFKGAIEERIRKEIGTMMAAQ
jgi:hypothetical protein